MSLDPGLAISVAGLLLSAAGFAFTILQLRRTARATEAVEGAVAGLKNRMAAFDYVSECIQAGRSLQHTTQLLRLKQWIDAASTLSDVQSILNRVSVSREGTADTKTQVRAASESLLVSIQDLEEAADKQIDFHSAQLVTTLRKLRNLLDAEMIDASRGMYNA